MEVLIWGLVILTGVHLVAALPGVRPSVVKQLGERHYKTAFAAIALGGLVMMIVGKSKTEFLPLWHPPGWGSFAAWLLMLPAIILIVAAYSGSNLKRKIAHPMLLGVALWAGAHLLANGDLASMIMFGGLGVFSLAEMALLRFSKPAKPFKPLPRSRDVITLLIGLVLYAALLFMHPWLFGVGVL